MKTAGVDTLDAIRARFELAEARLAVARRPELTGRRRPRRRGAIRRC